MNADNRIIKMSAIFAFGVYKFEFFNSKSDLNVFDACVFSISEKVNMGKSKPRWEVLLQLMHTAISND